jgi:hypothetical protein
VADTINFKNWNWHIIGIRSAEHVKAEFPDPRMGLLMEREQLELLLLREVDPVIDLMILRIYKEPAQTIVFRNRTGNILDPGTFSLPKEEA